MEILDITSHEPEPTLADVLRDLWLARLWLAGGMVLGLLGSLVFLALAVPQYKAEMLVSPTTHSGTPDISGLFPENAGTAMSAILQSFGPGDSSDFERFGAIVRQPSVAAMLLRDPVIRNGLTRARRWRLGGGAPIDSATKLSGWLNDHVEIEPVGTTRLKKVSVSHPDPAFAVRLLQTLYIDADDLIRGDIQGKTAARIAYLNRAIAAEQNPEHQRDLTKVLMDQEQIAVILAVHESYSATIAEPAAASAHADWPRKSFVLPACVLVGMVFAYILYGLRRRWAA